MREVDTDALSLVAAALGIGNPATAREQVQFDDSVLQQVLDVAPLVRRAVTVWPTTGLFAWNESNVHAGAGTITTTKDFYNGVQGTDVAAPFPGPIARDLDVWLLGAMAFSGAATGALGGARLDFLYPPTRNISVGGGQVDIPYRVYDAELGVTGIATYLQTVENEIMVYQPVRIPRGVTLRWITNATGAATYTLHAFIGLFGGGLGQDGVGG